MDRGGPFGGNNNNYPKYRVHIDDYGDSRNFIDAKDYLINNEDEVRRNMRDSTTGYDRMMFDRNEVMPYSFHTPREIFERYNIPMEVRTFERLAELPVWSAIIRQDYKNISISGLTHAERLDYGFNYRKDLLNDLLNKEEFKPVNDGKYPGQIFIRDEEALYFV
ncbi:MAG: hypothetical protein Q4A21_00675 [bacterium]|nr:hypothetical protein [bacterium]